MLSGQPRKQFMAGNPAHLRIDEGIPRGPRRPAKRFHRSPKADIGTWIIPKDLDPQEVLDRYLTEATTSQIAAQYGLSRKALVRWLRQSVPEQWREVQLLRAHCKLESGEDGLEAAPDALSLARMREMVKAAQFRLQALDKDYHPKQELTIDDKRDLGDRLRRARERVIEGESVALPVSRSAATEALPTIEAVIDPK